MRRNSLIILTVIVVAAVVGFTVFRESISKALLSFPSTAATAQPPHTITISNISVTIPSNATSSTPLLYWERQMLDLLPRFPPTGDFLLMGGYFGRMNNQRQAIQNALLLAYLTGRTLVLPKWSDGAEFGDYLDLPLLQHMSIPPVILQRNYPSSRAPVQCPEFWEPSKIRVNTTISQIRSLFNSYRGKDTTVNSKALYYLPKTITNTTAIIMWIRLHIQNDQWIKSSAQQFIQQHLPPPYLAYHSRHLEGSCGPRAKTVGLPVSACEQTFPEAKAFLESLFEKGQVFPRSFFLGTDGQRPQFDKELTAYFGFIDSKAVVTHLVVPPAVRGREFVYGVIDLEIMCQANWFVGSSFSSLSANVKTYRDMMGSLFSIFIS